MFTSNRFLKKTVLVKDYWKFTSDSKEVRTYVWICAGITKHISLVFPNLDDLSMWFSNWRKHVCLLIQRRVRTYAPQSPNTDPQSDHQTRRKTRHWYPCLQPMCNQSIVQIENCVCTFVYKKARCMYGRRTLPNWTCSVCIFLLTALGAKSIMQMLTCNVVKRGNMVGAFEIPFKYRPKSGIIVWRSSCVGRRP